MDDLSELVGESPGIAAIRDTLRRLLDRQRAGRHCPPILLLGDTGTGKGLVARLLHRLGPRAAAPFVDVNCAAIPETLIEAELFGFERGAFTDAHRAKPGLFHAAHGGVLFLDEIALLPLAVQAKLLTAIEDRAARRLGSTRAEPADAWLISAANTDLKAAVAARRFREDLYHRVSVFTLELPPLHARGEDVLLLAERFLARACAEYSLPSKRLTADAKERLLAYSWPGNVRELGNVIERATLFTDGVVITADVLRSLVVDGDDATGAATIPGPVPAEGTVRGRDEILRGQLLEALEQAEWNISLAAARLGVARNTVYARLEKFGLRAGLAHTLVERTRPPLSSPAAPSPSAGDLHWESRSLALLRADIALPDGLDAWSQTSRAVDALVAKVHTFGGRIEELSPTSFVAVFGLASEEDAPRRAAHVACAIHKSVERARERGEAAVCASIGLHVARCLIGRAGSRIEIDGAAKRAHWPTLDQLLEAGRPGETVASREAAAFLARQFELAPLQSPTEAHPGLGFRLVVQERRGLGLWAPTTAFVGRGEELEILRRQQSGAGAGRGQVVAVLGEPGVGKSRLIHEFIRDRGLTGGRILETAGISYGQGTSYLPVIELLKGYFAILDRDDPQAVAEKVTRGLKTLGPGLAPIRSALMALLAVPVDDATWRGLEPSKRRRHTLDAVRRLLLEEARRQPLLLIIEDLHWIDGETQAVLDTLVENLGSTRVLLLVSYRPQYRHAWAGKTFYTQLPLDVLPAERAGELLDALLGDDPGLAPLKQRLVDRANPLLLEETVRTLVETHVLSGDRGGYRLTQPIRTLQLPPTVQALLTERIDRLPAEDRRVLQTASVIGTNVPLTLLEAVVDIDSSAVKAVLERLQISEFLYATGHDPDVEYAFKHALTHEAAYATLARERRRELHTRIVDVIETRCADRLADHVERLAHHALSAELTEKAARYLRQAGVKATARSALPEARARFEQALDILAALPESRPIVELRIDLCLELRPLLVHLGEVGRALERLREAEHLAEHLGDDQRRGRVCAVMTNALSLLGEPDEALVIGRRAMEIAQRSNDLRLRVLTTTYLEQAYITRGDYEEVVALALENIRSLPAEWGDEFFGAAIPISIYDRYRLINALAQLGRFHEAARYEAEVLRLAEPSRYAITVAMVHDAASWCRVGLGDWETAHVLSERALVAHREGTSHLTLAHAVAVSAHILARLGEADEALRRLRESLGLVAAQALQRVVVQLGGTYYSLARSALVLGRVDEARSLADRALTYSSTRPGFAANVRQLLGELFTQPDRFDTENAERCFREALILAEPRGIRPVIAHCHFGLGKLYRRSGSRDDAQQHFDMAAALYRDMGMAFWLRELEAESSRSR